MRRFVPVAVLVAMVMAGPVMAEDWQRLSGAALKAALEGQDIRYDDGSEQLFYLGGITRYSHGWPNEGRWKVVGEDYCSQWPPDMGWHCFAVYARDGGQSLRFEGPDHRVVLGRVQGPATWP